METEWGGATHMGMASRLSPCTKRSKVMPVEKPGVVPATCSSCLHQRSAISSLVVSAVCRRIADSSSLQ